MRPELVALAQALRALLPPGLAIGWSDPTAAAPLWPGEALPGAIPRRQTEFSAGRAAARAAMTSLGFAAAAIPAAPDRAPVWPPGITGSISHSATACLAILGRVSFGVFSFVHGDFMFEVSARRLFQQIAGVSISASDARRSRRKMARTFRCGPFEL